MPGQLPEPDLQPLAHPPSLDGLPQNLQVSDAQLSETLLKEYGLELARLALALLGNVLLAWQVVRQTIVQAVLNRHHFWGEVSLRAWLFRLAVIEYNRLPARVEADKSLYLLADPQLLEALGAMGHKFILVVILSHGCDFTTDEIAFVLGKSSRAVSLEIQKIDQSLQQHLHRCVPCSTQYPNLASVYHAFKQAYQGELPSDYLSLQDIRTINSAITATYNLKRKKMKIGQAVWFLGILLLGLSVFGLGLRLLPVADLVMPEPTVTPMPVVQEPFYYTVMPGDTLFDISQRAGVSPDIILSVNHLTPDSLLYPGQTLLIPISAARSWLIPPEPIDPDPPDITLSDASSIQDIVMSAIRNMDVWRSVWLDVLIINYGLPGYVGPPQSIFRKQAWIIQPSHIRILEGPAEDDPFTSSILVHDHLYVQHFKKDQIYESLFSGLIYDFDLQSLFLPVDFSSLKEVYQKIGEDTVAGRRTIVIDKMNISGGRPWRFWIDAQYGVILRRRSFGGPAYDTVLSDVTVIAISFDVPIPPSIYDPDGFLGDQYAQDYTGQLPPAGYTLELPPLPDNTGHQLFSRKDPPPAYNPSHSRLVIQPGDGEGVLDIFTPEYYLGNINLGSDNLITCKRSPDGRFIAYSYGNLLSAERYINLRLVDLIQDLSFQQIVADGSLAGDFAFSPDSNCLAFFSCRKDTGNCAVFIHKILWNSRTTLLPLTRADYFLWKPDGQYLAMISTTGLAHDWKFIVVDANSGEITYQGDYDWTRQSAAPDAPTHDWGTPFQLQTGGWEGCLEPPEGN